MAGEIAITADGKEFRAVLDDTPTARAIVKALPFDARANRWGDEIYFSIPVEAPLEGSAREVLDVGELGFWPPGSAFCIFFGPTPASEGEEIRAASPVNIIGRIEASPDELRSVQDGARVSLRRCSEAV